MSPGFHVALTGVRSAVRNGASISEAMAQYPLFFPELYRASLRSGEHTGALPDVLRRYITYVKLMISIQEKVMKAIAYPVFLILVGVGVVLFLVVYVMPSFANIYAQSKATLPLPTQWLLTLIETGRHWLPAVAAFLCGVSFFVYRWRQTPRGRYWMDTTSLHLPVLGDILLKHHIVRLMRTLSTILSGGIPLVMALTITGNAMTNQTLIEALRRVTLRVQEGGGLASALKKEGFLPTMTLDMIEVGETTGSLEGLLLEVAEFHESELDLRLSQLTTWIEPVLLVIMGLLVGGIVILMYLPIFQMAATIS
jgi:type IV pilus assembly protein PilC